MTCRCGYWGEGVKMSFNVTEAYNYLRKNGTVYTVRPNFSGSYIDFAPIHIHRRGKWTGEEGSKNSVVFGTGQRDLEYFMKNYVKESGFDSVEAWMKKLIETHGEEVTTLRWIIYRVVLSKGQTTLEMES